jgi:hypothetical protein
MDKSCEYCIYNKTPKSEKISCVYVKIYYQSDGNDTAEECPHYKYDIKRLK